MTPNSRQNIQKIYNIQNIQNIHRSGSRTAATSKMELFEIIVNGFQPLTIITKCSILDVAAVPDPHLILKNKKLVFYKNR